MTADEIQDRAAFIDRLVAESKAERERLKVEQQAADAVAEALTAEPDDDPFDLRGDKFFGRKR